jgi:uncharacterized protein YjbJ (UPF0337 family)
MLPADLKETEVMDENRVAGSAQQLGGSAKELTGSALGDTKLQVEGKADKAEGTVRNAVGGAKDAAGDLASGAQDELSKLRSQVERLMGERVTPALADAAETAQGYARQAKDTAAEQSERAAAMVKERPLLAVGLFAAVGYLVGRLAGGKTYVYPRR